jgi:hypothetical protein
MRSCKKPTPPLNWRSSATRPSQVGCVLRTIFGAGDAPYKNYFRAAEKEVRKTHPKVFNYGGMRCALILVPKLRLGTLNYLQSSAPKSSSGRFKGDLKAKVFNTPDEVG